MSQETSKRILTQMPAKVEDDQTRPPQTNQPTPYEISHKRSQVSGILALMFVEIFKDGVRVPL